jgi:ribosomal protein L11 methyltransferase
MKVRSRPHPEYPAVDEPGIRNFLIPTSQAFGTGQHATTAGCLAMLAHMKAQGAVVRSLADIGTGTGLLAFAGLHLWPGARAIASDIDAVCGPVVATNADANGVALGDGPGKLAMVIAAGMDHPLLRLSAPYDLLIANILAGPLIELAPEFAAAVKPGGHILLAGLLATQERAVRAAYAAPACASPPARCAATGRSSGCAAAPLPASAPASRKRCRPGRRSGKVAPDFHHPNPLL